MTIRPELLDELLKDYTKPEDLVGEGGLLKQLTKALVERCLETEMSVHLDQPHYKTEGKAKRNRRNGHSQKTIKGEFGQATLDIPRDPLANILQRETLLQIWLPTANLNHRWSRRGRLALTAGNSKILSLYGRGMTTRDIQAQLEDMYGVEVSATLTLRSHRCRPR